jgi:hypothetical protein
MFRSILSDRTFAPITLLPSGYSRLMGRDESGIRLCSATHLITNCSSLILRSGSDIARFPVARMLSCTALAKTNECALLASIAKTGEAE